MSSRNVVLILVLVLSEAAGLAVGEWYFRLYLKAIPPIALSSFNAQSSHVVHLFYGGGVGLALFVWFLVGMTAGKLTRSGKKAPEAKAQNAAPIER